MSTASQESSPLVSSSSEASDASYQGSVLAVGRSDEYSSDACEESTRVVAESAALAGQHPIGLVVTPDEYDYDDQDFEVDDSHDAIAACVVVQVSEVGDDAQSSHDDGVGAYADEDFEADSTNEPTARSHEDYDSEIFEDDGGPNPNPSDDGTAKDHVPVLNSNPLTHQSTSVVAAGTQHPDADMVFLLQRWTSKKVQVLDRRGSMRRDRVKEESTGTSSLPASAVDVLMGRLHAMRTRTQQVKRVNHSGKQLIPSSLLDRAKVHHLLALSTLQPPNLERCATSAHTPKQKDLSTFCSVKRADLEGKLATARLEEMCARWETPHESGSLSIATMEFLSSIMLQQREALGGWPASKSPTYVFNSLKTHATSLDRAKETARLTLRDSVALRDAATKLLEMDDAHKCTCFPAA